MLPKCICWFSIYYIHVFNARVQDTLNSCLFSYLKYTNSLSKVNFFFFFYWRYNPLCVLAFSVIFFHSALSLHNILHPLIPIIRISIEDKHYM
jgi:hypothetical protein